MIVRRTISILGTAPRVVGVAPPAEIDGPLPPPPSPPSACYADFRAFLSDLDASSEYTDWCSANPGDCSTWTSYVAVILAGGSPRPPAMSTGFGTALVDAGVIALDGITPCVIASRPHASFTFAVSGLTVSFVNTAVPGSSGRLLSWTWTFGDGSSSTDSNPVYTYTSPGTYLVTLTVVGAGGDGTSAITLPVTTFIPGTTGIHIDAATL